jgi:Ca2+-binding EF-hand superfamily protein
MFRTTTAVALIALMSTPTFAQMRASGEGIFDKADTNGDGSITREEFRVARTEQFARFDRNGDGYLDSNDVPKRALARREQNGGGGMLSGQFDANGDGKVSKDEFVNGPTLIFDRSDADSNGVLDAKEIAAAKEAAKAAVAERRNRQ